MGEHMDAAAGIQARILKVHWLRDEPKGGLDFCSNSKISFPLGSFHLPVCCQLIFDFVPQASAINSTCYRLHVRSKLYFCVSLQCL